MFRLSAFLLTALLISKALTKNISPYDLEDEILEKLDELRATVRGEISVASRAIEDLVTEVHSFRYNVMTSAELAINQEYQTLQSQLSTLKDLAHSAGHDVEVCLSSDEEILNRLPQEVIDSLLECLVLSNSEITTIYNTASYRITILINEVNVFEFQLDLCAGDLLCMSPLVTQIELAMVEIPQKIGVEVQHATELCEELKVLVEDCTLSKVAHFNTEGGIIVSQITECINDIIS